MNPNPECNGAAIKSAFHYLGHGPRNLEIPATGLEFARDRCNMNVNINFICMGRLP